MIRHLLPAMLIAMPPMAAAQLKIDINRGNFEPLPIALTNFDGNTKHTRSLGKKILRVIKADLQGSGLFRPVPQTAFIEQNLKITDQPKFGDWAVIQAEALAVGHVNIDDDKQLTIKLRLFDVLGKQQLLSLSYLVGDQEKWRLSAHIIADAIYKKLTGDSGYFNSRIAFISESGPRSKRIRKLAIMDQDGANTEFLTDGRFEVLTPRFSPTSQTLIYTALVHEKNNPLSQRRRIFLRNLQTGREEVVGNFPGMTFAARFSPNGKSVVMSLEENGNSDIFVMRLADRKRKRLTVAPSIDTSPSFSPDGKYIVFNSDRGGSPQLYVIRTDRSRHKCPSGKTATVCRISFGKGRYSTPVWSPRGDLIAFTRQRKGKFYIGVIKPNGRGERLITESYLDEGPTWSPNGRVIAFFRENYAGKEPTLMSIDLSGRNLKRLRTPDGGASDPAWSPLLQ